MEYDLVVENARIIDGTGSPWFRGSVSISDGSIKSVTRNPDSETKGKTEINAKQQMLTPGFIDTHSHSDLELFNDPLLEPKVRQGITTEILGQDGFSMAPMYREGGSQEWKSHLSALEGEVDKNWTWGSTTEYLDEIEKNGIALNVGMLVGHGTVRFNVLGMSDRSPTSNELEEMENLVTESLEEGALGFSTGLIYTPAIYSDSTEVQKLVQASKPYNRPFVAHIRSEGRWIWEALDELIDISAEEGVPLHISHFKVAGASQRGKASHAIHQLEIGRERGVDITAEQYPYDSGSTMLSTILPPTLHAEGPTELISKLRGSEIREKIRRDIEEWRISGWENFAGLAGWENVYVTNVPSNTELEGMSIQDIASQQDKNPIDSVCDLLIENELSVSMRIKILSEDDVREIFSHEFVNAATDGLFGGAPHPRVYGTYPRILGKFIREENVITIEKAIQKMTSLPARVMGLHRKGLIRPDMDADFVIFDPDTIQSPATYDRPHQFPKGITHVGVNGRLVVENNSVTQQTPGEVLRK